MVLSSLILVLAWPTAIPVDIRQIAVEAYTVAARSWSGESPEWLTRSVATYRLDDRREDRLLAVFSRGIIDLAPSGRVLSVYMKPPSVEGELPAEAVCRARVDEAVRAFTGRTAALISRKDMGDYVRYRMAALVSGVQADSTFSVELHKATGTILRCNPEDSIPGEPDASRPTISSDRAVGLAISEVRQRFGGSALTLQQPPVLRVSFLSSRAQNVDDVVVSVNDQEGRHLDAGRSFLVYRFILVPEGQSKMGYVVRVSAVTGHVLTIIRGELAPP